jgi:hypothetical protein
MVRSWRMFYNQMNKYQFFSSLYPPTPQASAFIFGNSSKIGVLQKKEQVVNLVLFFVIFTIRLLFLFEFLLQ